MHPGIKSRLQLFRDNTELQKNDNRQLDEGETERNGKERSGGEKGAIARGTRQLWKEPTTASINRYHGL